MMMTEKYYTLPCYSTIYPSSTKTHRDYQKTIYKPNTMKLLIDQQPTIRTHSLYDIQQRID
jgi:hypothetical protein